MREGAYMYTKEGTRVPLSKYRGCSMYSINKTGGRRKIFLTVANLAS
jgi:hypothetical protein